MLLDEVKEIIADVLDVNSEEIDITTNLADDLGADSLDAIDIVASIEDQYSVEVPDESIKSFKTVEDVVSFIEANLD